MINVHYRVTGTAPGHIRWEANEDFTELLEYDTVSFDLGATKADDIEKMEGLSMRSKILLSAVAGAVIQFLLDHHMSAYAIFETGVFWISKEE